MYGMHFIVPEGTTEIDEASWPKWGVYAPSIRRVTIPNTVTHIACNAFKGFDLLKSMQVPYSVKSIGSNAFEGCTSLASLEIPSTTSVERLHIAEVSVRGNVFCAELTMLLVLPVS